jgi:hypothetical protein
MRILRTVMGWVFGISWLLLLLGSPQAVLAIAKTLRDHQYTSWNFKTWLVVLMVIAILLAAYITFLVAWWTNWRRTRSARGWGIAASLIFVMLSIEIFIDRLLSSWGASGFELAIGVLGLIAFAPRMEIAPKIDDPNPENESN